MTLEDRVQRLETRVDRGYRHLENVMITQYAIVQQAFDQIRIAMLEQQAAFRAFASETRDTFREFGDVQRETSAEIDVIKRRLDALENPPTE